MNAKIYSHPTDQDSVVQIFLEVNEISVWCTDEIWKGKVVLIVNGNKLLGTDFCNSEI